MGACIFIIFVLCKEIISLKLSRDYDKNKSNNTVHLQLPVYSYAFWNAFLLFMCGQHAAKCQLSKSNYCTFSR